jgi:DEAD/DEAH box helicase domain-containing protein
MVASSAPLDQFMVRNPSYFFDASPERALIDPDNLHILVDHIKCAAFEMPFSTSEAFGRHDLQEILGLLAEQGLVHRSGPTDDLDGPAGQGQWVWTNESYPADAVSLRSISSDNFVVVDTTRETRVIGETDFTSGPATLHAKAIYLIEGQLYQVERFDFEGRKAFVREIDCDYYTTAITYARVTILDTFAGDGPRAHGEVHVVSRVVGFKKIKFYTNENVGSGELDLPEQQMHTTSYWLTIPVATMAMLPYAADDRRDGVVGLAHAIRQVAQLLLMCDTHDIGISIDIDSATGDIQAPAAEITAVSQRTTFPGPNGSVDSAISMVGQSPGKSPQIFIYDNYPGGIGFSAPLSRMHEELLAGARRLIADCGCENGCPGCVGPIGDTGPLAKAAALRILDLLMARQLAADPTADTEVKLEHAG